MPYDIGSIAITVGVVTGMGSEIPKFERRLKHFASQGLLEVTGFKGDYATAPRLFDREEACLAALLVVTSELFEFGVDLQRASCSRRPAINRERKAVARSSACI